MYDPAFDEILAAAISRLYQEMRPVAPVMAERTATWIGHLSATPSPVDYFKHPAAFPTLLLPWWLEQTLQSDRDLAFQADLLYSSVNGYYFIRLLDNVMDGNASEEVKLLPVASFFHMHFQATYQRYFDSTHPFWGVFTALVSHWAETTLKDASLDDIDAVQFVEIAGQKTSAAKLPVAAVCYRYERADVLQPWFRFIEVLSVWHQMRNDLFGWQTDLKHQTPTYFLCEARRRKRVDETVLAWVAREGFAWGVEVLSGQWAEVQRAAELLRCPDVERYVAQQAEYVRGRCDEVTDGLRRLAQLVAAW